MDADVVVVGAGPVGSTLGLMLRAHGLRALVVDRASFPRDKPCGEGLLPAGSAVLGELGIDLGRGGFPRLEGVRYRMPGQGWVRAPFSGPAFGVRRTRLDALLAELSGALTGVEVKEIRASRGNAMTVETTAGALRARVVVGADGLRSRVRRMLDPDAAPSPPRRYGLVGHLEAPGHGRDEITVTLLDGVETYLAVVEAAHPELAGASPLGDIHGAGPFQLTVRTVALNRLFLVGDASGFCDPLTGDAISAGLAQARALARLLVVELDASASGRNVYGRHGVLLGRERARE